MSTVGQRIEDICVGSILRCRREGNRESVHFLVNEILDDLDWVPELSLRQFDRLCNRVSRQVAEGRSNP